MSLHRGTDRNSMITVGGQKTGQSGAGHRHGAGPGRQPRGVRLPCGFAGRRRALLRGVARDQHVRAPSRDDRQMRDRVAMRTLRRLGISRLDYQGREGSAHLGASTARRLALRAAATRNSARLEGRSGARYAAASGAFARPAGVGIADVESRTRGTCAPTPRSRALGSAEHRTAGAHSRGSGAYHFVLGHVQPPGRR
jgi:hypothetical protein